MQAFIWLAKLETANLQWDKVYLIFLVGMIKWINHWIRNLFHGGHIKKQIIHIPEKKLIRMLGSLILVLNKNQLSILFSSLFSWIGLKILALCKSYDQPLFFIQLFNQLFFPYSMSFYIHE